MARKRMISPEIWESRSFSRLSDFAKLIFIGLFSQADDEGYGNASPGYIRSKLFPNDEERRLTDIKKALSEIALGMSINFYEVNGDNFYHLTHWSEWQKVDRPTKSRIPKAPNPPHERGKGGGMPFREVLDESSMNARRILDESSATNRIEKNRKECVYARACAREDTHTFSKPTVEDIAAYATEIDKTMNAQRFYDFYESKGWTVGNQPMHDWKACVRSWEPRSGEQNGVSPSYKVKEQQDRDMQADCAAQRKQRLLESDSDFYEAEKALRLAYMQQARGEDADIAALEEKRREILARHGMSENDID